MTADQQFILALLGLIIPVVSPLLIVVVAYVNYRIQVQTHLAVKNLQNSMDVNTAQTIKNGISSDLAGAQAKDAYTEANHANMKIQAVQDVLNRSLGLDPIAVTQQAILQEALKKDTPTP